MEIDTKFADVRPGMYFALPPEWGHRGCFILKKSENRVSSLILESGRTELWTSLIEWNRSEWNDTWMSDVKPTKPDYHLIIANLWGRT